MPRHRDIESRELYRRLYELQLHMGSDHRPWQFINSHPNLSPSKTMPKPKDYSALAAAPEPSTWLGKLRLASDFLLNKPAHTVPSEPVEVHDLKLRFTSLASVMAFDAFHLVEQLLTQPLQIVIGSIPGQFSSYQHGHELFERATCKKDLHVIEGACHYDLYEKPQYVDQVGDEVAPN